MSSVGSFVAEQLAEPLHAVGIEGPPLPDDLDFLAEGVVDSFGFLELVLALEQRYDVELDLEELDPDDITRAGPLIAYVSQRAAQA